MPRGEHLKSIPREVRAARLGQKALAPGEASELLRIRAKEEVLKAFKALSPEERGRLVEGALWARGLTTEALTTLQAIPPEELEEILVGGIWVQRLPEWLVRVLSLFWRPWSRGPGPRHRR